MGDDLDDVDALLEAPYAKEKEVRKAGEGVIVYWTHLGALDVCPRDDDRGCGDSGLCSSTRNRVR